MADISIKANDRRPVVRARLGWIDEDKIFHPADLTDAESVDFIMRLDDPTVLVPKVNAAAEVEDAVEGAVVYPWAIGDTDSPGDYRGEFEVHWPDDIPETFPTKSFLAIEVIGDLDSGA